MVGGGGGGARRFERSRLNQRRLRRQFQDCNLSSVRRQEVIRTAAADLCAAGRLVRRMPMVHVFRNVVGAPRLVVHPAIGRGDSTVRVFAIGAHLNRPERKDEDLGAQCRPGRQEESASRNHHSASSRSYRTTAIFLVKSEILRTAGPQPLLITPISRGILPYPMFLRMARPLRCNDVTTSIEGIEQWV